jgi:DNA-binding GntR family transcriptional regulator
MSRPTRTGGRRPGAALYKQIAGQIEADIAAGTYPVGSLLPTEAEFGARLDAGRHTVRAALGVLAEAGLITRRAGSGSTVVSDGRRSVYAHSVSNFDQWFNYPEGVQRRRIDHGPTVADAVLADGLGCEPGTKWFRISALRVLGRDGALPAPEGAEAPPLCWLDIYVQPRFAGVVKSRQIDTVPVHEQLESRYGVAIAEVEVRISAGRVPAHMAAALGVEPDSPALLLRRRYLSAGGELLQATCTVHPENRYVYEMRFQRAPAGARLSRPSPEKLPAKTSADLV